jgi:mRNA-degrading endonuclease YafQ of YafQ-DinJ toxin-antitoxin module
MYQLAPSKYFLKKSQKFIKNNQRHQQKLEHTLKTLTESPFSLSLKTHRVSHKIAGKAFSSWVTGDIRTIWDFAQDGRKIILLIDLGGHSGKDKVYR